MSKVPDLSEIVVDSSEQLPWWESPPTVRKKLKTGDYSLLGFEDRISIERKSIPDAFKSCGKNRIRFIREWGRLHLMEFAGIVIEGTQQMVLDFIPHKNSKMRGSQVVGTLKWWEMEYDVDLYFEPGRDAARDTTLKLLGFGKEWCLRQRPSKHEREICATCGGGGFVPHETRCNGELK